MAPPCYVRVERAARLYSLPMPTALSFDGLRRRFGQLAVLGGVSGRVAAGEALLVTGRNGAGKSTLLRCLAGLLLPDSGTIDYREDGAPAGSAGSASAGGSGSSGAPPGAPSAPLDAAERRRRVGLVAPDIAFYGELTVAENLAFFSRLRGLPRHRGDELLRRLELPPDRPAAALSSGMRQRLRWAWALLHAPRLLLLDEPFQNLDAAGVAVTRRLLEEHLAGAASTVPGSGAGDRGASRSAGAGGGEETTGGPSGAGKPGVTPGLAVIANPVPLEIAGVAASLDLGS
jgi:ABC-type transport system involved in cytochrome c biogenesis ATPase subunit